ncbi:hypothetical protein BDN71DRAFT_1510475 [Pleurotus eryngii]|uniref:DUF6589 domain-containing protein n=1 Tax=Pleurotus eryngii TaxID=5323 RepID=A0A9P5ZPH8_PLEER|nr:hypothetical protein BDN71DRAFT_1510475 [Pleurotus eryngii]
MNTEHLNDDNEQHRNPSWDTPFYMYSTPVHHPSFPTHYPPPPWATPMFSDTMPPQFNSFPPQMTHAVNPEERKTYRDQGAQAESSARHWDDKLSVILDAMKSVNWKLGDLLYYLFRVKTETGAEVKRSRSHAQVVSKFLGGKAHYYPSIILAEWLKSADGLPKLGDIERDLMYSTEVDYQQIWAARPGLTSFAAQLVGQKLEMEIKKVVMKKNGLQTFTTGGGDIAKAGQGINTYTDTQAIFRLHQPLTWAYLLRLATPCSHQAPAQGTVVARKVRRRPNLVVTHMMGELAYSRNMYAKMISQKKGLLLFACRANRYLVSYNSHVGSATSYHATYEALRALAKFDLGLSYVRPCNLRLGREAGMNIGMAATAFVMKNFSPAAVDLQKKFDILALKSCKNLTVCKIRDLIDYENLHQALILQWLRTLVTFVPQLHQYKHAVSTLYATEAKKMRLPLEQTKVFPLSTNGRNETVTTELLKALMDFFKAIGQVEESYNQRLIYVLGDGLTYERMVLLKLYLQFHETPFHRLDILKPGLETRILRALATVQITYDRSLQQMLRKSTFTSTAKLLTWFLMPASSTVGDDLLTYFMQLHSAGQLPTLEKLRKDAKLLFHRYGHSSAFYNALKGHYKDDQTKVPCGQPWEPQTEGHEEELEDPAQKKGKGKKDAYRETYDRTVEFKGDQALAESTRLIMDLSINCEMAYATADGDPGRVWDVMKHMTFTFTGSSHTKYSHYMLEQLCDLELESAEEEWASFLANYLVNPSGKDGHWIAGDQYQEQLQDELYEHMSRNDKGFDEGYMCNVIAPNTHRFLTVKKNMNNDLGLAARSGKHIEPHNNPELQKLLGVYCDEGLHQFQPGRQYSDRLDRVDDLGRGMAQLYGGKLETWVDDTMRARGHLQKQDSTEDLEDEATLADPNTADQTGEQVASEHVMCSMEAIDQEIVASDATQIEETEANGAYIQLEGGELVMELCSNSDFEVYGDKPGEEDAEEEESVEHESSDNVILL